jgi:hypothetical protein
MSGSLSSPGCELQFLAPRVKARLFSVILTLATTKTFERRATKSRSESQCYKKVSDIQRYATKLHVHKVVEMKCPRQIGKQQQLRFVQENQHLSAQESLSLSSETSKLRIRCQVSIQEISVDFHG